MTYHYTAYGLSIASEIECPELQPIEPPEQADVTVAFGEIPQRTALSGESDPLVRIGDGMFQLEPRGFKGARYRIVGGHTILVQPLPGASPAEVRLFLLGSAFGLLLHLRGVLPLHASAIVWDGQAIAFSGHSGAGKSTLAAAFHRRGHALLTDDIGVVVPGPDGAPLLYPSFPRLKLWSEALEHFNLDPDLLTRDKIRSDKYHLHLQETFHSQPLPLAGIYFLAWAADGSSTSVCPMEPVDGIPLLNANTYRVRQVRRAGDFRALFQRCASIAKQVPLYRYTRPMALNFLEDSLDALLETIPRKQESTSYMVY